jgi:ABC-type transport system substrate-binding protein
MVKQIWYKVIVVMILVLVASLLAACGGPPPTPVTIVETVVVTKEVQGETKTVIETVEVVTTVEVEKEVEKEVVVTATPEPGRQTLVVGLAQSPVSLDPADHRSRESETVIRNMFDGLVTRDTTSGVHMELAEERNWVDDTTLEVKLRQGVKFHDGTDMTADDVV